MCSEAASAAAFSLFNNVFTDGEGGVYPILLMAAGVITILWTSTYLILIKCCVSIVHPVTIGFELICWLFGLGLTGAGAGGAFSWTDCSTLESPCKDWEKVWVAMGFACALLLIDV